MMELLPSQDSRRPIAIMLLVIALILLYFVGFHWFFVKHGALTEETAMLTEQIERYQGVAAQREVLQERLRALENVREDDQFFLPEGEFSAAAAGMTERLKQAITTISGEDGHCQLSSNRPVQARDEERFERVTVQVRMRCQVEDLVRILYQLENELPVVLVDDVNISYRDVRQARAGRRPNQQQQQSVGSLDVRFNMIGYLGQSGGAGEEV